MVYRTIYFFFPFVSQNGYLYLSACHDFNALVSALSSHRERLSNGSDRTNIHEEKALSPNMVIFFSSVGSETVARVGNLIMEIKGGGSRQTASPEHPYFTSVNALYDLCWGRKMEFLS
ncbi:hypothetical protein RRG08_023396 [Elysia crispata]|uniref:Uncharacterized protein n=1 Tax=Elysia crispata TaxID=231223 RepID=A0AAE0YE89_9GAST|nr:hypothetical protein RRG08_023396 [Elysia crispata]